MNDEIPGLPMFQGKSITIVNDKVRNLDIEIGTDQSLYNLTKEAYNVTSTILSRFTYMGDVMNNVLLEVKDLETSLKNK